MKVWMSVSMTRCYDGPASCSYGYMHISTNDSNLQIKLSYKEAHKQLLKLSKVMGKQPLMHNNQYDPMITTRELYGYVNWE